MGNYAEAINIYQQILNLQREEGNRAGEGNSLYSLGWIYNLQGQYQKAIEYFQQTLAISREMHDRAGEVSSLYALGWAYDDLGQPQQSIVLYQQALAIARENHNRLEQATTLNGLGWASNSLRQYQRAIEFFQQQLVLAREIKDRKQQADALNGLGWSYKALKRYQKAILLSQQSLAIQREIGDYREEAYSLGDLGNAYNALGHYQKAMAFYQQSLAIQRKIGNRWGEGITLSDMGDSLVKLSKPELAIIFYKQSVNTRESIRKDIQGLPVKLQQSFTKTVTGTYRSLANLLLSQGRLSEAQQVLELLKVQELKNFTRSAEVVNGSRQVIILKPEQEILQRYGTVLAFSQKLNECERTGQVCKDLRDDLDRLTAAFNQDSNVFIKELRERLAKDPAFLTADQLGGTATDIVTAEPGTVLVYPLVLPNKLRILLAVKAGEGVAFRSFEVPVSQQQLWETVAKFRGQISTPQFDRATVNTTSQQLYDWLIRPLEAELKSSQIQHLVFALDRSTRYIPMAALYNKQSKQYLIEKYAISTILSAELTDVRERLPPDPNQISVLALGASAVKGFNPLPNVPAELAAIVGDQQQQTKGIFQGQEFLNQDFNYDALRDHLAHRQIVHIASHAAFEKNAPEQSFILLGTGDRLTIENIQQLQNYMRQVDLVVLSACQTAVGGPDESGIEIPGISFYFLRNKVKSVIASLWAVSDSSTSLLMQQFYKNLATGKLSKAEALRQAQLALLQGKLTAKDAPKREAGVAVIAKPGTRSLPPRSNFSHPYYWAPFILIGNSR